MLYCDWAAGTGKTALLAAQDMLTEVVFDSDTCVFRSAPTRTAARLNRGDTVHAAWSLPWSSCLGTHGRLTEKPLQRLRQRLRGKEEATIDEISMLPPDKFYQIICRAAQGMNQHAVFMGVLKLRLSGEFLQLPPVRSSSFAAPKETSSVPSTSAPVKRRSPPVKQACEESKQDSDEDDDAAEERRLGVQKFQLIKDVVCLNRVVRAPNALGALCTFVRHCKITDAVWTLLQSLVLRENDDRLGSAVWQKSSLKMIVQRHTLRVSMSNAAVLEHADKMSSPVYLCAARDEVDTSQNETRENICSMLQSQNSLGNTGRKPSVLMLYKGARLLLDGKDCATLGLMNGTEVIVEEILLTDHDRSDAEQSFSSKGNIETLKHMPEGLIVRVPGARWVLPATLLPGLPEDSPLHKRRGLFLVRPSSITFIIKHENMKYRVRRTQFSAVPANAVIVYGAQGESYDTAIADLGMPPSQDPHIFLACSVCHANALQEPGWSAPFMFAI